MLCSQAVTTPATGTESASEAEALLFEPRPPAPSSMRRSVLQSNPSGRPTRPCSICTPSTTGTVPAYSPGATPPPASGPGGCGTIQQNANAEGNTIGEFYNVPDIGACCKKCQDNSGCNLYVYCPQQGGCDNGYGKIYDYQLCTLKASQRVADGQEPNWYFRAPGVPWTSGWLGATAEGGKKKRK
ncbi:hypothetical protein N2152v2_004403 [Parachlorella kessleri]